MSDDFNVAAETQTMLIRSDRSRIVDALASHEEITCWMITSKLPEDRIDDETVIWRLGSEEARFNLLDGPGSPLGASILVRVSGEILGIDWPEEFRYLQAWVESGRRREDLEDPDKFETVQKSLDLHADVPGVWQMITDSELMGQWLGAQVAFKPELGGTIDILWPDGSHVGGEVVLIDSGVLPPPQALWAWGYPDALVSLDRSPLVLGGTTSRLQETLIGQTLHIPASPAHPSAATARHLPEA